MKFAIKGLATVVVTGLMLMSSCSARKSQTGTISKNKAVPTNPSSADSTRTGARITPAIVPNTRPNPIPNPQAPNPPM